MGLFAIGDIHGNHVLLRELLGSIRKRARPGDRIVFLGDIVDGGPDSRSCVELILELKREYGPDLVCVKGNHEEWLLETRSNYARHSWVIGMEGLRTIESYSAKAAEKIKAAMRKAGPDLISEGLLLPYDAFFDEVPASHMALLESMVDYYEDEACICVHAGISPRGESLVDMEARKFRWGFEGFPEAYTGKKAVIYGHWSRKAKLEAGRVIPYTTRNTVCLDTLSLGVLSAMMMPGAVVLQAAFRSRQEA